MKYLLIVCLLVCIASGSDAPPRVMATGQWKNDAYELWSSGVEPGDWVPEKGEPPLPVSQAVILARKALRDMLGEEEGSMMCLEIHLSPGSARYLVTFATSPTTAAFAGKKSFTPTVLHFAVFSDGTVRAPRKSRSSH